MYRSFLLALALVATTSIPVHAQVLPLEPGDRVRIESGEVSGEFTVVEVQPDTLVVPAGRMVDAMELLLTPVIERMIERRDLVRKQSAA